jgi:hypothetical protein
MKDWQYFWRGVLLGHTAIPTTVGGSAPTVTVQPVKDVSSLNHQVQKRPTSLGVTECGVRHSKTSVPFAIELADGTPCSFAHCLTGRLVVTIE